jgi:hypothetical protein
MEYYAHQDTVKAVLELREVYPTKPLEWACEKVGVSRATYHRYAKEVKQGEACISDRDLGGRPAKFQLTTEEVTRLRYLVSRYDGSFDYAIKKAAHDTHFSPEVRGMILDIQDRAARRGQKERWPEALRRLGRVTPAEMDELRGKKHSEKTTLMPRIGLYGIDANGEKIFMKANSSWSMDDESINRPYLVRCNVHPDIIDQVDERYHWKLCRQVLKVKDIYSRAWLGMMGVGRERDQYRGEDILRFIKFTADAWGTLPEELILEQGRWKGNALQGVEVCNGHKNIRWGGLDKIVRLTYKPTSNGKTWLESDLRRGQRETAFIGEDVGHSRGEMELANKHYLQIQRQARLLEEGKIPEVLRDPLDLGFLPQGDMEEIEAKALETLNWTPMQMSNHGNQVKVPMDLYQNAITPRPIPDAERWRFYPVKREKAITRGGMIECAVEGYQMTFMFVVNGVQDDLHLENGYRCLIAFDPAQPNLGCVVANAEISSKNRHGFGFGEIMITAPLHEGVPIHGDARGQQKNYKKAASASVRNGFAAVKKHHKDERAARITHTVNRAGEARQHANRPDADLMAANATANAPRAARRAPAPLPDLDMIERRESAMRAKQLIV